MKNVGWQVTFNKHGKQWNLRLDMLKPCNRSYPFKYWKQLSDIPLHYPGNECNRRLFKDYRTPCEQEGAIRAKSHNHMKKELEEKGSTVGPIIAWKSNIVTITSSDWIANKQKIMNQVCNEVGPSKTAAVAAIASTIFISRLKRFHHIYLLISTGKTGSLVFSVTLWYWGTAWAQKPQQKFWAGWTTCRWASH